MKHILIAALLCTAAATVLAAEQTTPREVQVDPAATPVLRQNAVGYARHTLQFRFPEQIELGPVQVRTGMRKSLPAPAIDTATSHMYLARLIEGVIAFDCSGAGPKVVEVVISSGPEDNAPAFRKLCNSEELVQLLGAVAYELRSTELAERFRALLLTAAERQGTTAPPPPTSGMAPAASAQPVAARIPKAHAPSASGPPAPLEGNVQLSWEAPKRLSNGKRIRDSITRYRIHGSQSAEGDYRVLAEVPGNQKRAGLQLDSGQWYLAVTAVLPDGSESAYSAEVTKRVP